MPLITKESDPKLYQEIFAARRETILACEQVWCKTKGKKFFFSYDKSTEEPFNKPYIHYNVYYNYNKSYPFEQLTKDYKYYLQCLEKEKKLREQGHHFTKDHFWQILFGIVLISLVVAAAAGLVIAFMAALNNPLIFVLLIPSLNAGIPFIIFGIETIWNGIVQMYTQLLDENYIVSDKDFVTQEDIAKIYQEDYSLETNQTLNNETLEITTKKVLSLNTSKNTNVALSAQVELSLFAPKNPKSALYPSLEGLDENIDEPIISNGRSMA